MKGLCTCGRPAPTGIRAKRMKAGLSLAQVAERAGLSVSYLVKMETGSRACSGETRDRVLAAIEGKPYTPPPPVVAFEEQPIGAGL